jgi:hypothetical protein
MNPGNNNLYALPTPLWTPGSATSGGAPTSTTWPGPQPTAVFDLGPVLQQAGFTIQGIFRPTLPIEQHAMVQPTTAPTLASLTDMRYCRL